MIVHCSIGVLQFEWQCNHSKQLNRMSGTGSASQSEA
jgi:hypothetical protein